MMGVSWEKAKENAHMDMDLANEVLELEWRYRDENMYTLPSQQSLLLIIDFAVQNLYAG